MRLLLVNLPKSYSGKVGEPFGIEMLAASLKRKHSVDVLDAQLHNLGPREFARLIARYKPEPDAYGISAQPSSQQELKAAVEEIRLAHGEGKLVVAGGHLASSGGRRVLEQNPGINALVVGRGEIAAEQILSAWESGLEFGGIANAVWRSGQDVIENPRRPVDYSLLPWADRSLFEQYSESGLIPQNKLMMYKSGGCVGICPFCKVHSFFPRSRKGGMMNSSWSSRLPQDVAEEMMHLYGRYGRGLGTKLVFDFVDADAFGLRPMDWLEISESVRKGGIAGRIEIWISTRLDEFAENEQVVRSMAQAGLRGAFLGLESSLSRDIELYRKNSTIAEHRRLTPDAYREMAIRSKRLCDGLGIRLKFGWVNVHADTTIEDVLSSMRFLKGNGLLYNVSSIVKQLAVYDGSALQKMYARRGILSDPGESAEWFDRKHAYRMLDKRTEEFMRHFRNFKRAILEKEDEFLTNTRFVSLDSESSALELGYLRRLRELEYNFAVLLAHKAGRSAEEELSRITQHFIGRYCEIFSEYARARESGV